MGHAYSALFTWDAAKKAGGQVLLRIEDIDLGRCRGEYRDQIYDDLAWLGLSWPKPVRIQSEHFDDYRAAAAVLRDEGLLFPCFCSRKQIVDASDGQKDPDGAVRYPGTCRHLSLQEVQLKKASGEKFSLRLDMARAIEMVGKVGRDYADLENWGDVVLVRKDIPTSYHLSVVVDDGLQGITHVTRGMDMFAATAIHILLQKLLELETPDYQHHELVEDNLGRKLAKSEGDKSLKALRAEG
ncbi:Glutamyl-Q tRNA(Asp) synthetase, partial [hydrothermal vent metagenome]